MSDSNSNRISASAPNHPEARYAGDHLVIDKTEWVPGKHPDPNRRREGQTEYLERYLRCIECRVEVLSERDLPVECHGDSQ